MLMQAPQESSAPRKISADWRNSAKSIIEMGKYLLHKRERMLPAEFAPMIRMDIGIDNSGAGKLINIAKHKIISNPKHFDKLPQRWALLYEAMFLPDDVLLKAIADGSMLNFTKYDIWRLRGRPDKRKVAEHIGARDRVAVPDGMTLEQLCRSGIELEAKEGMSPELAARQVGIGAQTYRMVRGIIFLKDKHIHKFNDDEKALIKETLDIMNKTKNVRGYYDQVKPLIKKVWGDSTNNHRDDESANRRIEAFRSAVIMINDTCMGGLELELPLMPVGVRTEAVNLLTQAREAVSQLRGRIRKSDD